MEHTNDFNLMSNRTITKRVKKNYNLLLQDSIVRNSIIVAFLSIIISVIYLFFMTGHLPSEVPLYYSLPWGQERLAQTLWLLLIPGISFIFFIINIIIVLFSYKTEPVLSRLFAVTVGFVSFLGAYTVIRIILLVT